MAVSPELMEILVCPDCKGKVELRDEGNALQCVECKRIYPVRDDIPVMIIEESYREGEEPPTKS